MIIHDDVKPKPDFAVDFHEKSALITTRMKTRLMKNIPRVDEKISAMVEEDSPTDISEVGCLNVVTGDKDLSSTWNGSRSECELYDPNLMSDENNIWKGRRRRNGKLSQTSLILIPVPVDNQDKCKKRPRPIEVKKTRLNQLNVFFFVISFNRRSCPKVPSAN